MDNDGAPRDEFADRARPRPRSVGLRVAALAGVIVSAGVLAAGAAAVADSPDSPVDSVQSGIWPMGSTCCPEEAN